MTKAPAVPLKHIAGINERALSETTDPDLEFGYIDIGSVGQGELVASPALLRFKDAPSRARRLVQSGDTIVSTVRTYLRAVWPVPTDCDDLVVSTGFAVLTPRSINPRFFSWYVRSDVFIDEVVARSVGVSYPAINALDLGEISIRLPGPEEQRAIADYLDAETARIDALITKKRRMIDLLRERERVEIDLIFERLAVGFGTGPVAGLCDLVVDCVNKTAPTVDDQTGYGMLRTSNVRAGRVDVERLFQVTRPTFVQWTRRGRPRPGDVLLTREAPVGEVGILDSDLPLFLGQRLMMYRAAPGLSSPEFLAHALRTTDVQQQMTLLASGSLHEHLRVGDCSKFRIPQASPSAQDQALSLIRAVEARDRGATEALSEQLDLLKERRQALITAAVTGELEIPGVAA